MISAPKRSNTGGTGKKMVIKAFKEKPRLPEDFEDRTWDKLQRAVVAVFERRKINDSEEDLYRDVENLCLHKMAANLYGRVEKECSQHITKKVNSLLAQAGDPEAFLPLVEQLWKEHCQTMATLQNFFLCLDRTYVLAQQNSHIRPVWELGLWQFRKRFQELQEVQSKTVDGLLALIQSERQGLYVPRDLLKTLVRMLVSLRVYDEAFEKKFLEETARFYENEGNQLISTAQAADFLAHVERRINQEEDRLQKYLDIRTRSRLLDCVRRRLLENHTQDLLDKGFMSLVEYDRVTDLERLYRLYNQVDALPKVRAAWSSCVKKFGAAMMKDEERENQRMLVGNLLEFKTRLDTIHQKAFQKNLDFHLSMKDSFETFLNENPNVPASLLAKYVDELLRGGSGGASGVGRPSSDLELDETLDRVMVLFRYLYAKDTFEAFYKKDLAKRLLLSKSSSTDAEKSMIQKLKEECGTSFTTKLEGMFKDMDLSRGTLDTFLAREETQGALKDAGMEFTCHVLTTGTWPHYTTCADIAYPNSANRVQEMFRRYYLSKHSGRSLKFLTSLGQATLRASFTAPARQAVGSEGSAPAGASGGGDGGDSVMTDGPAAAAAAAAPSGRASGKGVGGRGRHELVVSHCQAIVLLLFNHADSLSCDEIEAATKIERSELVRTLQSLSLHKVNKLLIKRSPGREVSGSDVFEFNSQFLSKLFRLTINQIQSKETKEEADATQNKVFEDRQYQVDAAIVRIMKYKKTAPHQVLMTELFSQIRFPCKSSDVKKRIESLIEREYLERNADDPNTYNYLA
ncbi:unnamed protein product [Vitrella brassicaformis CCMP3155]|uniref:Cullin-4 n=3 Tax=Vitrella brassicaformis TaxID=1169539 RepID=A0A0G4EF87_VITBC|nr:unnamed protein product [Vitrella brassicaformis CCMP3155]|eukprot:CEL94631.1 unnamed protein product [Vitrella brassicaformis CCMP3155]